MFQVQIPNTCDRMDISLCCRRNPMLVFKTVVLSIFRLFGLTFFTIIDLYLKFDLIASLLDFFSLREHLFFFKDVTIFNSRILNL